MHTRRTSYIHPMHNLCIFLAQNKWTAFFPSYHFYPEKSAQFITTLYTPHVHSKHTVFCLQTTNILFFWSSLHRQSALCAHPVICARMQYMSSICALKQHFDLFVALGYWEIIRLRPHILQSTFTINGVF